MYQLFSRKLIWIIVLLAWSVNPLVWCGLAWGATVYVKDISDTVYYESGASSCDDVTSGDTSGDLEAALTAVSTDGTLYICAGTMPIQI